MNIGDGLAGFSVDTVEHVITHEIGHTIGLRHTDFFNRSISCGSGGNEGDADVGAIHIPGTPTGAVVGGSIMNSCFRNAETGEFTAGDISALTSLYGRPVTLSSAWQSIAGDFNGDGKADYARLGATGAWIFYSTATGNAVKVFQSYTDQSPALDFGLPSPWQTIAGDFNGDGKTDYIRLGATGAWLFFGSASGIFTRGFQSNVDQSPALNFGAPSSWQAITGDFNGDGKTDYARLGATGAWLFFGSASGSFTRGFQSYVDQSPTLDFGLPSLWQPVTGDFNGDGKTDYARLGATGAWLFFGSASGSFTRGFQSYVDQSPTLDFGLPSLWQPITGDFDGDGKTDYVRLGDTGAWVFLGSTSGSFTRTFQSYVDETPVLGFGLPSSWQPITGDLDGTHRTDYVRAGDTGVWKFFGNANRSFTRVFQSY